MDVDALVAEGRALLRAAIAEARGSANPVLAELGRELAAGRITPYEALAGSAYRDLLEERVTAAVRYHLAPEEEKAELATEPEAPSAPAPPAPEPAEDFSERTFMIRATERPGH